MLLFELFDLLENRINFLKKNLAAKVQAKIEGDATVDSATADEFIDKVAGFDPSKKKLYTQWMITLYLKGQVKAEDLYKFQESLEIFDKYKGKLPKKDINQYKTPEEFNNAIDSLGDLDQHKSKNQKKKDIKHEGADKVYEDNQIAIVKLKTEEAACEYGKGTKWCTAATGGNNMFDYYNKEGPIYVIMDKKTGQKWQWHFESQQFMDELDNHSSPGELMKKYPVVRDALSEPIEAHRKKHPDDLAFMTDEQISEYITSFPRLKRVMADGGYNMDAIVEKFPEIYQQLKPEIDEFNQKNPENGFFWTTDQIVQNIQSVEDIAKVAHNTFGGAERKLKRSQFAFDMLKAVIDHIDVHASEVIQHLQRGGIMVPDIPEELLAKSKPSDFTTDEGGITDKAAERYMKDWRNLTGRQVKILLKSIRDPKDLPEDYLKNAPIHHMAEVYSNGDELVNAVHAAGRKFNPVDAAELIGHFSVNDLDKQISTVLTKILLQGNISDIVNDSFAQSHGVTEVKRVLQHYLMSSIMADMDNFDAEKLRAVKDRVDAITDNYIKKVKQTNVMGQDYEYDEITSRADTMDDADDVYDRIVNDNKEVGSVTDEQLKYVLDEMRYNKTDRHFVFREFIAPLANIEHITPEQWDIVFNDLNDQLPKIKHSIADDFEDEEMFEWNFANKLKPLIDKTQEGLADELLQKYPDLQGILGDGKVEEPEFTDHSDVDLGDLLNQGFS